MPSRIYFPDLTKGLPEPYAGQPAEDNTLLSAFKGLLNSANDIAETNANNQYIRQQAERASNTIRANADLERSRGNDDLAELFDKQADQYDADAFEQTLNPFQSSETQSQLVRDITKDFLATSKYLSRSQNELLTIGAKRDAALDEIAARAGANQATDANAFALREKLARLESNLRREGQDNESRNNIREDIQETENRLSEIAAQGGYDIASRTISAQGGTGGAFGDSGANARTDAILSRSGPAGQAILRYKKNPETSLNTSIALIESLDRDTASRLGINKAIILGGMNINDGKFLSDARGQEARQAMFHAMRQLESEVLFQAQPNEIIPPQGATDPEPATPGDASPRGTEELGNSPASSQEQLRQAGFTEATGNLPQGPIRLDGQLTESAASSRPATARPATTIPEPPTAEQLQALRNFVDPQHAQQAQQNPNQGAQLTDPASPIVSGQQQNQGLTRQQARDQRSLEVRDQIDALQAKQTAGTITEAERKRLDELANYVTTGIRSGIDPGTEREDKASRIRSIINSSRRPNR